ncbi:amidohydrolase family protein [Falsiroseomonas oryzae]|uniref:amidohydrolase family protein n=1 Tax=Falsiroseomonas oryzae TaxID=2766473 RepID=UPI0022EB515D|nr:amidohydrolase family protein [Roseomonas sp. MO-31]
MGATLLRAATLIPGGEAPPESPGRVLVEHGSVVATGDAAEGTAAEALDLGALVLLPGFVNAHQHGRGLSQAQLGYRDDRLEAWGNRRRRRGAPDAFPLVQLAALRMLANGVTACLHANWSYGGDQAEEVETVLRAYDATGIRAAVMLGVADRGALVYPGTVDEATFLAGLDPALRELALSLRRHPFPGTAEAAVAAFDSLAARWRDHPRLSLGFGPAGPQWVSDALFADIAAAARDRQAPLHFHLLESPAQARACAALYPEGTLRRLATLGVLGPGASAAHGVFLTGEDIALMAKTGTTLVANPGSNLRLGCGVPDYAALRAAGVRLALGGDDCELQDDRDPWAELRLLAALAGSRATASPPAPGWAERLAMATEAGAHVLGLNGRIGRIAPGYAADIIALDPAPARHPWCDPDMSLPDLLMARASGRDVRMTMVAGRVLYRDGAFPDLDLAQVEAAAVATARAARRHPSRDGTTVEALGRALLAAYDAA